MSTIFLISSRAEGVENDDLVNAVQEFRPEGAPQGIHDPLFHLSRRLFPQFLNPLAPHIGGHDEHRVLEIHGPALSVGHSTVIQDLEKGIEDIRMGLFDLVKEDYANRGAAGPPR